MHRALPRGAGPYVGLMAGTVPLPRHATARHAAPSTAASSRRHPSLSSPLIPWLGSVSRLTHLKPQPVLDTLPPGSLLITAGSTSPSRSARHATMHGLLPSATAPTPPPSPWPFCLPREAAGPLCPACSLPAPEKQAGQAAGGTVQPQLADIPVGAAPQDKGGSVRRSAAFPAWIAPLEEFFSCCPAETCWADVPLLGKLPGRHDAGRGCATLAWVPQGCQQHAQHTFHTAVAPSIAQHQNLPVPLAKWAAAATLVTPTPASASHLWDVGRERSPSPTHSLRRGMGELPCTHPAPSEHRPGRGSPRNLPWLVMKRSSPRQISTVQDKLCTQPRCL